MAHDALNLTLAEAAEYVPQRRGRCVHPSTIHRWARSGVSTRSGFRVRLEVRRVGGRLLTSAAALDRFFRFLTEADAMDYDALTRIPRVGSTPPAPRHPDEALARASNPRTGAAPIPR